MRLLLNATFRFTPAQRTALQAAWPGLEIVEQFAADPDLLDGAGVAVLCTEQVPRNLAAWPKLRWVQLLSAGANQLLGHPILTTPLPVTTASGTHGVPIAQYVTCAALMLAHRMPQLLEFKASRQWPNRLALAGSTLRGRTAGILGYGSIGRECARQLSALGLNIVCLKRDPAERADRGYNAWPGTGDPEGRIPAAWFGPDQLAEMLPQCDLVVVTLPSTPATTGSIGARELALCRPSAHLILISRGGIVAEPALAEALRAGRLAGAAVDCFVQEPLPPDHLFFAVPNLMLTPHMSGVYDGFWPALNGLLRENLQRFQAGRPLLNEVSRQQGY
ncbi:D-2-hydroxyacid dehydrogenase [Opitutus sp. GAS368]|uniref:D-2-hydroxyacid dehydrogenase n=1 Tax=Opitutus sp. GAS368 TaxID=1882749 RepID=UPI0008795D57|nr:D-2-hydroxyacid dehydrogenase [Opitutus sp. GAS368]SDS47971.1 Phosphoglycerate dehydrogenase [Opitutus sp. GAS368]